MCCLCAAARHLWSHLVSRAVFCCFSGFWLAKETPWRAGVTAAKWRRWLGKKTFKDEKREKRGSNITPIGPLPLVSSVLISTEPSGQVEGAVGGQPRVHPLGKVKDLGRRERFPIALLPLEPALAAARRTLLPPPGEEIEEEEKRKLKKLLLSLIYLARCQCSYRNTATVVLAVLPDTRPWPSPGSPVADLLLGSVPAGSFLQAAYEEGERHGQDDDAAHHRCQHGHSEATVLWPGDGCRAKVKSCDLLLKYLPFFIGVKVQMRLEKKLW